MTTTIDKIEKYSKRGIPMGDNCENEDCQTEEKPIYHIKNEKFGIDIILCPKCLDEFKKEVSKIKIG